MTDEPVISMFVKLGYWEAYRLALVLTVSAFRWLLYLWGLVAVLSWLVVPLLLLFRRSPINWAAQMQNARPLGWMFGLSLAFLFVLPLLAARRVVTDKRLNRGVTYQLSNAGIRVENPVAKTDLSWPAIQRIRELRSGFLLFTSRNNAMSLPKRCINTTHDAAVLRELFRTHVPGAKLRTD